jgi:hypothetical protein
MKSRKIQRLEFVSEKIKGEDSKRNVVCILFVIAQKSGLVEAPMEGKHGQTSSSIFGGHGELGVRGGKGKRGEQKRARLSTEEEGGGT